MQVVVGLYGGLGNQLFQYAAGRALALRSGAELVLDTIDFSSRSFRRFLLDSFNIEDRRLSLMERHRLGLAAYIPGKREPTASGIPVIRGTALNSPTRLPERVTRDVYLDGTWQHPLHFASHADVIRREFTPRAISPRFEEVLAAQRAVNSVAVHVRRTDFLLPGNEIVQVCSVDYFRRAIAAMREKVGDAGFCIFSDDIGWVAANVPIDVRHVLMPANTDQPVRDFLLMAACRHFVISNSTYSWWAAWLGTYPGKCVIAPTPWLNVAQPWDPTPPEWLKLPARPDAGS
jgi:hypothetical protein